MNAPTFSADGWIEFAIGGVKSGTFVAGDDHLGILPRLEFYPKGESLNGVLGYAWHLVNSARLFPKTNLTEVIIRAHEEAFSRASSEDPFIVVGWLTSPGGVERSDLFTLICPAGSKTSREWLNMLAARGVEVSFSD